MFYRVTHLAAITSCVFLFLSACSSVEIQPAKYITKQDFYSESIADSIFKYAKSFPENTQLSIALLDRDTIVYQGFIRKNDTLHFQNNAASVFEIGSLSKVFTSLLLAHEVVHHQVNLNDPIQDYLGFPLKDSVEINLKHLANHTSGLPRMPGNFMFGALLNPGNPYATYTEDKLQDFLSNELELESNPGEKVAYSNLGAGLLGYILEKKTGKSYEELLQTQIFQPLNMKSSTTSLHRIGTQLVTGLDEEGIPTPNWTLGVLSGAGGISSNVVDLSRFVIAQFDSVNHVFQLAQKVTFKQEKGMDVALGWFLIKRNDGQIWHWHNGGTGGYTSSLSMHVQSQKAVIILSNVSAFHPDSRLIDKLNFSLMENLGRP